MRRIYASSIVLLCEVQFHGPHQISLQLLGLQDSEFCDPSTVLDLDPDSLPLVR